MILIFAESHNGITGRVVNITILRGRDGRNGRDGRDGLRGPSGMRGPTGDKGDKGDKGDRGDQGQPGTVKGGVVYTRFGRKSCRSGTQLLYEGITAGSHYTHRGGGANYLCLPKVPQYLSTVKPRAESYLYGTEYESYNKIFRGTTHDHNVPCAVCYNPTNVAKVTIAARVTCPSSWTREYYGYLMTEYYNHPRNAVYECIDTNPEVIHGTHQNTNGALFYFVEATCGVGIPCRPYQTSRAITCVVCTK